MTCSDDCSIGRFSGSTGLVFVAGGELAVTNHPIWGGPRGPWPVGRLDGLVQAETLNVAVVPTNTAFGLLTVGAEQSSFLQTLSWATKRCGRPAAGRGRESQHHQRDGHGSTYDQQRRVT